MISVNTLTREHHEQSTSLFTAAMNIFGLVIIELVKIVDAKAGLGKKDPLRSGLIWTSVLQGGLLLLGLILLVGQVQDFVQYLRLLNLEIILNLQSNKGGFETIKR